MAQQSAIAAKSAITAISLTGTAYSFNPMGKDASGVLNWVHPGATALDNVIVDFSYRPPKTSGSKTARKIRGLVRLFVPKTAVNSTTGVTELVGENIITLQSDFLDNATATEKQLALDLLTSTIVCPEFRDAFINGNVMW